MRLKRTDTQSKSNQIKSNQIKSNQIKTNTNHDFYHEHYGYCHGLRQGKRYLYERCDERDQVQRELP